MRRVEQILSRAKAGGSREAPESLYEMRPNANNVAATLAELGEQLALAAGRPSPEAHLRGRGLIPDL